MKRILTTIAIGIFLTLLISCEKIAPQQNVIEIGDGVFECVFYIPPVFEELGKGDNIGNIQMEFHPLDENAGRAKPYLYTGELSIYNVHTVTFRHGGQWGEKLPHGKYKLRFICNYNGKYNVKDFICISTVNETYELYVAASVNSIYDNYLKPLNGNDTSKTYPGSKENPYVIANYDDFKKFSYSLRNDETSARGLHFMQTKSIEVPGSSGELAEDGWFGNDFAGYYSGADNETTIRGFSFNGSDMGGENNNIGLFRTLKNGASFNSMIFDGDDTHGVNKNSGILAGSIEKNGIVEITNCSFRGNINGTQSNTGGIVGYMNGGSLTIKNCDLGVRIRDCGDYTGGVVGLAEGDNPTININTLTCKAQPIIVEGEKYVGGMFGRLVNPKLNLNLVDLANETSQSENKAVVGNDSYVGGIAGEIYVSNTNNAINIQNTTLSFPIEGKNYVGGLFGKTGNTGYTINLDKVRVSSNLIGKERAGGFIGGTDSLGSSNPLHINMKNLVSFGVINSNYTKISGEKYVGGMIGSANNIAISSESATVNIKTSVEGSNDHIGGLIGILANCSSTLSLKNYYFAPESKISGNSNVGGVCGTIKAAAIDGGRYSFKFQENKDYDKVITQDEFESQYIGEQYAGSKANVALKVEGTYCIGGIAGYAEHKSKISNIYVAASVTGTEHVGGAIGKYRSDAHENISYVSAYKSGDNTVGYHFDIANSSPYKNCYIQGVIIGAGEKDKDGNRNSVSITAHDVSCGGIVGYISGSVIVSHCINYSPISNGKRYKNKGGNFGFGGIAGDLSRWDEKGSSPLLYYCVNTGDINADSIVGGVCGRICGNADNIYLNVQYCANYGKITCNAKPNFPSDTGNCGGVVGEAWSSGVLIVGSANHGNIYANTSLHGLGGIAGVVGYDPHGAFDGADEHNGVVIGCANTGRVENTSSSCDIGGIVGWLEEGYQDKGDASVVGSYNKGEIPTDGEKHKYRGGIVGYVDRHAEIRYCLSFLEPSYDSGECDYIWGGEKGDYSIANNYMIDGPSGKSYAGTVSKSDMNKKSSFPKFYIDDEYAYWKMKDGDPHPQIRYCPFQNATYNK